MALPYRTTGSLCPAFASARLVSLAVKHAYAIALSSRCPTVTSVPSNSSVTLWEETAQSNCLPCTVPDPDNGPRLEPQTHQGGISTLAPQDLATLLQSLPPILHRSVQSPIQSYSKGSWGLSVFPRGDCIITNISTSLSLRRRQCGHRYAIRAGRNLPDKEFRYLRTVIVTAAVYWDFNQELAPHHLIFQHRAGVTPYTSTFVFAECCVFNKQSQPPISCNLFGLTLYGLTYSRHTFFRSYGVNLPSSFS